MNPQKNTMIIKQALEQHIEGRVSPWTLESPTTTLKTKSLSALTATSMDTWPRNADQERKNVKLENVSNMKKKGILQKTAKGSRQ